MCVFSMYDVRGGAFVRFKVNQGMSCQLHIDYGKWRCCKGIDFFFFFIFSATTTKRKTINGLTKTIILEFSHENMINGKKIMLIKVISLFKAYWLYSYL